MAMAETENLSTSERMDSKTIFSQPIDENETRYLRLQAWTGFYAINENGERSYDVLIPGGKVHLSGPKARAFEDFIGRTESDAVYRKLVGQ